jgi:hypothetical protein
MVELPGDLATSLALAEKIAAFGGFFSLRMRCRIDARRRPISGGL